MLTGLIYWSPTPLFLRNVWWRATDQATRCAVNGSMRFGALRTCTPGGLRAFMRTRYQAGIDVQIIVYSELPLRRSDR